MVQIKRSKLLGLILVTIYFCFAVPSFVAAGGGYANFGTRPMGNGGVFSSDFGLYLMVLPWSEILNSEVPSSMKPIQVNYEFNWIQYFNQQNTKINFFIFFALILLNALIILTVTYFIARILFNEKQKTEPN